MKYLSFKEEAVDAAILGIPHAIDAQFLNESVFLPLPWSALIPLKSSLRIFGMRGYRPLTDIEIEAVIDQFSAPDLKENRAVFFLRMRTGLRL